MPFKKGNTIGRQFVKGQVGNPGGRRKDDPEVIEIFKAASADAARKLVKLINHKDPYLSKSAAEYCLNRVFGRPRESVEVKGDIPAFVAIMPAVVDDADVWEAQAQKVLGKHAEH
jgi:hypothetical protein